MEELRTQIMIMTDSQKKKLHILERLLFLTQEQEKVLKDEEFNSDAFDETVRRKNLLISDLNKIDDGFESIYTRISKDIVERKDEFKGEIEELKTLIQKITDNSVSLQTLEESNKRKMTTVLSDRKSEIKRLKISSKTAAAYYKNMTGQNGQHEAFFLDKKK